MRAVYSINDIPVRVTDERLDHIFTGHPEMKSMKEDIINTLKLSERRTVLWTH